MDGKCLPALAGLFLFSSVAFADGSGTISDDSPSLDYVGAGPYFPANVTGELAAAPVPVPAPLPVALPLCSAGTPLCDVFTLTMDLSDALRAANANALLSITVNCAGTADDFDLYVLDAAGAVIAESANAGCPEAASLPIGALPNGAYTLQVIPYTALPDAGTFDLKAEVSGLGKATKAGSTDDSGLLAGALSWLWLLPTAGAALLRQRRRS